MRTFIGIDLPASLKHKIMDIQKKLTGTYNKIKWVKKENLHITLKFIGEVSKDLTSEILKHTNVAVQEINSFPYTINKIGAFPKIKHPKVIWVGCKKKNSEIHKMFHKIEKSLQSINIKKEKRDFHSHITIGRTKKFKNKNKLIKLLKKVKFPTYSMKVENLTLYKSNLSPQGPIYTKLGSCNL